MIRVEVVYAAPGRQVSLQLEVAAGASVSQVLDEACADPRLGRLDWRAHSVGIFGQVCEHSHTVVDGDRVEIYRPLQTDAKTARRQRAAAQQQQ